jgi:CheY-like chemotaxis protein
MPIISKTSLLSLSARLAKVHVLVVDDDTEMLQILRGLLTKLGFEQITTATDGIEAVSILRDKQIMRYSEVDLVITDWNMTSVSGLELIKFIRNSPDSPNPYMPIIMLSGRGEWADVEQARDAGFSEYLIKPFRAKALCDRILLCVENPRAFVSTNTYKGPSRRRRDTGKLPPGITTDRRQRSAENNLPGKALKGKIGFDINMRQIFTAENIDVAQEYLSSHADTYRDWAMRDVGELMHTLRNARQFSDAHRYIPKIKRLAFALKSHSGIFGYALGTQVAKSLENLCSDPLKNGEHQLIVIDKHIETLQHIFVNDVKGHGGATGAELIQGLDDLIRKYKQKTPPSKQPPIQESLPDQ